MKIFKTCRRCLHVSESLQDHIGHVMDEHPQDWNDAIDSMEREYEARRKEPEGRKLKNGQAGLSESRVRQ